MSAYLTVYVGPFVEYERPADCRSDAYELTDGRLCDLRGELYSDDGSLKYAGPNVTVPNIKRQLRFDRHRNTPVQSKINPTGEYAAFVEYFERDIAAPRKEYGDENVEVKWGVVPGYA